MNTDGTMPFGRYRGVPLEHVPTHYLAWLLTIELRQPLRAAVYAEAARRGLCADTDRDGLAHLRRYRPDVALVEELVSLGLRGIARRYHPDAGGTHEAMVAANHAADWIVAVVRELAA